MKYFFEILFKNGRSRKYELLPKGFAFIHENRDALMAKGALFRFYSRNAGIVTFRGEEVAACNYYDVRPTQEEIVASETCESDLYNSLGD